MNCSNPQFGFPCGKCLNCRIQYSSTWASRLMHELQTWNNEAVFVTLTFNNDFLGDNNLNPRDLQLFIKRLRKRIEPDKIKHFSCGEYGDQSGRRHYHSIIFGLSPDFETQKLIEDCWPFGFVKIGSVTYDSCRYVTDYVLKKYNGKKALTEYGEKVPPFRLMSNGLGKSFVLSDIDNFIANNGFYIRGKKRSLPRYYQDVIYWYEFEKNGQLSALKILNDMKRRSRNLGELRSKLFHDNFLSKGLDNFNSFVQFVKQSNITSQKHNEYKTKNFSKGVI